jgi:CRP-like cAMP-binding protein
MKEQPRNATVRAISFCNIYSLNKENFDNLLKKFPQFKKELELTMKVREHNRSRKKQ